MHVPARPLAFALIGLLALGGCSSTPAQSQGDGTRYVAGDGTTVVLPQAERSPAPPLVGPTLEGNTFDLAQHNGQVVAINVWASWCAPCRKEAPYLRGASDSYADNPKVQFVGLDTRDSEAAGKAFVRTFRLDYPQVVDPDGKLQLAFRDTLPPQAIPSTVFIDQQGRVAARILGEADRVRITGIVDDLLAEGRS